MLEAGIRRLDHSESQQEAASYWGPAKQLIHNVANAAWMLCTSNKPKKLWDVLTPDLIEDIQTEFQALRTKMREQNPRLTLVEKDWQCAALQGMLDMLYPALAQTDDDLRDREIIAYLHQQLGL